MADLTPSDPVRCRLPSSPTGIGELADGCGDGQAWVAVRGHQIDDLRARSGADVILWDAALPVDERRTRYQEGAR